MLLHTAVLAFFVCLIGFFLSIDKIVALVFLVCIVPWRPPRARIYRDDAAPVFLSQLSLLHTVFQSVVEGIAAT
ncbi:hypothetical protein BJY52DRAFT_1234390 [Lactarius psammicola]|nr:hypothetical protein BJY52DRAFT_1234390 [Lactarius psammicola]